MNRSPRALFCALLALLAGDLSMVAATLRITGHAFFAGGGMPGLFAWGGLPMGIITLFLYLIVVPLLRFPLGNPLRLRPLRASLSAAATGLLLGLVSGKVAASLWIRLMEKNGLLDSVTAVGRETPFFLAFLASAALSGAVLGCSLSFLTTCAKARREGDTPVS